MALAVSNSGFKFVNLVSDEVLGLVSLNRLVVPAIPFVWYREEEMVCPIEWIGFERMDQIIRAFPFVGTDANFGADCRTTCIVVQRNIWPNSNLYVCCHSAMYAMYASRASLMGDGMVLAIDPRFNHSEFFEIYTTCGVESDLIPQSGGLVSAGVARGSVFIHDAAFSPPGHLHFKINPEAQVVELACRIVSKSSGIDMVCIFVLFNDHSTNMNTNGVTLDNIIKEYIATKLVNTNFNRDVDRDCFARGDADGEAVSGCGVVCTEGCAGDCGGEIGANRDGDCLDSGIIIAQLDERIVRDNATGLSAESENGTRTSHQNRSGELAPQSIEIHLTPTDEFARTAYSAQITTTVPEQEGA
jgi:hypothetical protein